MKNIALIFAAAGIFALAPAVTFAQSPGRFTLGGTIDYARIIDDESFLGQGFGGAGSLGWQVTDGTALELEAGRMRHVRDLELFAVARNAQGHIQPVPYTQRWQGTATAVLASLAHTFGSGAVRPVVWGGGGLTWHGGTLRGPLSAPQVPAGYTLQTLDVETRRDERTTALTADGGVGFDVRIAARVTLRPFAGLRLVNNGNSGPKYVVRTGMRVGFGAGH